jgi:hypothetical protein
LGVGGRLLLAQGQLLAQERVLEINFRHLIIINTVDAKGLNLPPTLYSPSTTPSKSTQMQRGLQTQRNNGYESI